MSEITNRTKNCKDYEKSKELKTIKIIMPCTKCNGEMEFTGRSYITSPPYNVHRCNKCGYEEEFVGAKYPRIDYIEVD